MACVYFRLWGEMVPKWFPNYYHIMQLELFCQQLGKWNEIPFVQVFRLLHIKDSAKKGNYLMMQRREVASKPLPNSNTGEDLINALNPGRGRMNIRKTSLVTTPSARYP